MTSADRELARSEERFRLLVESVVDYAIFILDTEGVVQTWNAGAERLKGYREDEIVGRHYSTFYPDDLREQRLPERLLTEAREKGVAHHAGWRVRKDGSRFWANVVITALREDDGTLAGFAKVTRDMTESHRAEEAREEALAQQRRTVEHLEELDRWRRDFISSVTHDLRSPVTSILGFVRTLVEEDDLGPEERQLFAERILSNTRALEELIDHLRTFTLLEAGEVELALERLELDELVGALVADMEPVLRGHQVEVDVDAVALKADRAGLERVLRNLLENAAEHTPVGGRILLRAESTDETVAIEVQDDGEGIPEALAPRVFERYERGSGPGTGLGLSIVKQYVELHGGEVGVRSVLGEGATFRIELPAG